MNLNLNFFFFFFSDTAVYVASRFKTSIRYIKLRIILGKGVLFSFSFFFFEILC